MHCGPSAVTLHIGTVTESVTIGATLAADTVKTDESSLIGRHLIQDLPIKGRRADQFVLLVAGRFDFGWVKQFIIQDEIRKYAAKNGYIASASGSTNSRSGPLCSLR
jgi:hypothetical protein